MQSKVLHHVHVCQIKALNNKGNNLAQSFTCFKGLLQVVKDKMIENELLHRCYRFCICVSSWLFLSSCLALSVFSLSISLLTSFCC